MPIHIQSEQSSDEGESEEEEKGMSNGEISSLELMEDNRCCKCEKTRCINMHCLCFKFNRLCTSCACEGCSNSDDNEERAKKVQYYRDTREFAFDEVVTKRTNYERRNN